MYCSQCGGATDPGAVFCPHCGIRLAHNASEVPSMWAPGHPGPAIPATAPPRRRRAATLWVAALAVLLLAGATIGTVLLTHSARSNPAAAAVTAVPTNSAAISAVIRSAIAPPTNPLPAIPAVTKSAIALPSTTRPMIPAVTKTVTATPTVTPTADFAAIYKRQQSGVVRIETISCTNSGVGTGFLLSPTLVATVEHVIAQSAVVSLINGTQRTTGTVIGSDPTHDLALVRADEPLTGYQFHFATTAGSVGDPVAAIGFPIGDPLTMTRGGISGLDREVDVDGTTRTGLLETDAPVNPGNSGGPLIASDGSVVGLVDALRTDANGIAYAIPADQASAADRNWAAAPVAQPPANCSNPLGPSQQQAAVPAPSLGSANQAQLTGIIETLNTYFGGIDSGNYAAAYSVQSPSQQGQGGVDAFAKGLTTSYDSAITILDAQTVDATTVTVDLAFNSLQLSSYGPDGDTCDNWTIAVTMIQGSDGGWLMDGSGPYHGATHTTC